MLILKVLKITKIYFQKLFTIFQNMAGVSDLRFQFWSTARSAETKMKSREPMMNHVQYSCSKAIALNLLSTKRLRALLLILWGRSWESLGHWVERSHRHGNLPASIKGKGMILPTNSDQGKVGKLRLATDWLTKLLPSLSHKGFGVFIVKWLKGFPQKAFEREYRYAIQYRKYSRVLSHKIQQPS